MNESQELEYKAKNSIIQDKFRRGCDAIKEHGHLAMKSLFSNLDQRVGCWVEDARCRHSISSIFHVKKEAKAYTEELVGICQRKIKDATSTWVSDTFVPLMANEIYSLASSLGADDSILNDRNAENLSSLIEKQNTNSYERNTEIH